MLSCAARAFSRTYPLVFHARAFCGGLCSRTGDEDMGANMAVEKDGSRVDHTAARMAGQSAHEAAVLCLSSVATVSAEAETAILQGAMLPLVAFLGRTRTRGDDTAPACKAAAAILAALSQRDQETETAVAKAAVRGLDCEPTPRQPLPTDSGQAQALPTDGGQAQALPTDSGQAQALPAAVAPSRLDKAIDLDATPPRLEAIQCSARAVAHLARSSGPCQLALLRVGAVRGLVAALATVTPEVGGGGAVRAERRSCVGSMRRGAIDSQRVSPLTLIHGRRGAASSPTPSTDAGEHSGARVARALREVACALRSMAEGNELVQQAATDEGALPPLLALLMSDEDDLRGATAGAVAELVQLPANRLLVLRAGGVPLLVRLLRDPEAAAAAAAALAHLGASEALRQPIAEAGGIGALLALFDASELSDAASDAARVEATRALATLVRGEAELFRQLASELAGVLSVAAEGVQHADTAAAGHLVGLVRDLCKGLEEVAVEEGGGAADGEHTGAEYAALVAAGVVPLLAKHLHSLTASTAQRAAECLALLARIDGANAEVTATLLGELRSGNSTVRQRASGVLRTVTARGSFAQQAARVLAGGVEPLLALLRDGLDGRQREAQEYALWSLALALNSPIGADAARTSQREATERGRRALVMAGGVSVLLGCISSQALPPPAKEHAICLVAAVVADDRPGSEPGSAVAALVAADAVGPVVALLCAESSSGAGRGHAASVLCQLAATSAALQEQIAHTDGVLSRLITWLNHALIPGNTDDGGAPGAARLAASLLDALARKNARTAALVVEAGGTTPAVAMLGADRATTDRVAAARLVGTLAAATGGREWMQPSAVTRLSSSPSAILSTAGDQLVQHGIPTLTAALATAHGMRGKHGAASERSHDGSDEDGQRQGDGSCRNAAAEGAMPKDDVHAEADEPLREAAARAVRHLAATSMPLQRALAEAGAIDALVGCVTNGSPTVRAHAAAAIESLAAPGLPFHSSLVSARAIPQLARAVNETDETDDAARAHASEALQRLALYSEGERAMAAVVVQFATLLRRSRRTPTLVTAANALTALSRRSALARLTLGRASDLVSEIVAQLDGAVASSPPLLEAAAALLEEMAATSRSAERLATSAALASLVRLLRSDAGVHVSQHAAAVLHSIAQLGEAEVSAIVTAGGVDGLVALLNPRDDRACGHATAALREISRVPLGADALVVGGGVGRLAALLTQLDAVGTQERAAALLADLAASNDAHREAVASAALPSLAAAVSTAPERVKRYATAALWDLAGRGDGGVAAAHEALVHEALLAQYHAGSLSGLLGLVCGEDPPPDTQWRAVSLLRSLATVERGRTALVASSCGAQLRALLELQARRAADASQPTWRRTTEAKVGEACALLVEQLGERSETGQTVTES